MSIQSFEPYHGAVLTKIVRREKMSLSLIGRDRNAAWGAYEVNSECLVYVKHDSKGTDAVDPPGRRYAFCFNPSHVSELVSFEGGYASENVYVALVCGCEVIAFFPVSELWQCIDRDGAKKNQTVSVLYQPGTSRQLWVTGPNKRIKEPLKVPASGIDRVKFPR